MKRLATLRSIVIVVAVYVVLQVLISLGLINPYWQQILSFAGIMAISALGLNLIYGFTGQFSLGHAAFYGIGAYAAAYLSKSIQSTNPLILLLGIICGGILAGVVAFLIGLPILRLRSDYLGIATLGFGIIMKIVFDNADAIIPSLGGSRGMTGIPRLTSFAWVFAVFVLGIIILRNLVFSSIGRALVSIREDEVASEAVGVNTTKYKTIGFVIGCIYAGVAGGLYAHLYSFLHPSNFDFLKSIDVLLIIVLGGLGSISGTIIIAFAWTFLLEGLRVILPEAILDWRLVIYPLLLIIVMLIRPKGIFGGREIKFLFPKPESFKTPINRSETSK
ncbi:MAG: branched-chain amino acid ABC transporter permease [candidate division WOR-3 bacterium]|nr:branched-chain amino acid ABC transporter permease [candidate division WOR-3 bacterium]MDH5683874.1 branched-chain amino acid ABC transporter permease [candidate division WOR-3 bacterium]